MAQYILKEMKDLNAKGEKVVYPKMTTYSQKSLDDLIKYTLGTGSPFSSGVVKGVIETLQEAMTSWLSSGHTVKLDGIGTFSLSLRYADKKGNKMKDEDDPMNYRHVEVRSLNFKPDAQFVKQLRRATELERHSPGVVQLRQESFSLEERIARALQHIDRNGIITLSEYASLNGLSRSIASRELNALEADADVPIVSRGTAPHKVWTRK